eukprot:g52600.t1
MAGSSSPWLTPLLAARTQGSRDNLCHISLGPNKLISLVVPLFSLNSSTSSKHQLGGSRSLISVIVFALTVEFPPPTPAPLPPPQQ